MSERTTASCPVTGCYWPMPHSHEMTTARQPTWVECWKPLPPEPQRAEASERVPIPERCGALIERLHAERDAAIRERNDYSTALDEMRNERDEAQRAKYGTPCKCETWMQTAEKAEAEVQAFKQTSGDLCDECGWRGVRAGACAFCFYEQSRLEVRALREQLTAAEAAYQAQAIRDQEALQARCERLEAALRELLPAYTGRFGEPDRYPYFEALLSESEK